MPLAALVALPAALGPLLRGSWDPWAQTLVASLTAVGAAVTAGVRAWRDTAAQRAERADAPTDFPQQERTP